MVHESTVYFERCHTADLRDEVSLEVKTACWERWLTWYSASQTQIRILYARERIVHLAAGELIDPLPVGTADLVDVGATSGGGQESSPDEPSARSLPRYMPSPRTTGHAVCAPVCRPGWDRCASQCDGMERNCIHACQTEYSACMSGCI